MAILMSALSKNCAPPVPPNGPVPPDRPVDRSRTPVTTKVSPWREMFSVLPAAPVAPEMPVAPETLTIPLELNSWIGTSSKMSCCPTNSPSSKGSTVTPGASLGNGASVPSRSSTLCPVRSSSSFWIPNSTVPLTVLSELIPRFMLSLMHPVIRKTSARKAPILPAVRARRDILGPPVIGIPGSLLLVDRSEPTAEPEASSRGMRQAGTALRGQGLHDLLLEVREVPVQLVGAFGLGVAGEVRDGRFLGDGQPGAQHQPDVVQRREPRDQLLLREVLGPKGP